MSSFPRSSRRIPLSAPHAGGDELRYVQEAFETSWLSTVGPNLTALEREFSDLVGLPAVALNSGTAAVHLGLKLLGIRTGD
ncbi:MAG: DegT/DnrJ/EryC1/StrS family aminotransferase, partial [Verrucomicrobiales bacterium]|nr:DegT/DnrJ/EryC1/StrS family aminotransferase [Verrucomicrobiales bacterium]